MRRQQKYCTQSRGGALVDLSLQYDGNQLKKVTDQCGDLTYAGAMDFKDGADKTVEYEWDANGNMTRDRNKRISSIRYNVLNLPERINYEDGHIVSYTYAADGRKLRVKYLVNNIAAVEVHSAGSAVTGAAAGLMGGPIPFNPGDTAITPGITPGLNLYTTLLTMDYCGNHVYRNDALERTMNDNGYQADSTYYYYITDYQGNVRAVIDQNGALKEINNYYPYGGLMGAASSGVQPNKYSAKELDRENGIDWYDSQARMLDPMIGRTTTMDPMAEKYYAISPFAWCTGDPIRYIDPNGKTPKIYIERNGFGHAFITVGEGVNTIVYTYGRYLGGDKGKSSSNRMDPIGRGVLVKLTGENAKQYIKHELSDNKAKAYEIKDASDKKSQKYFDALFKSGRVLNRNESEYYNKNQYNYGTSSDARVIDKYDLFNNNCTTKSISGLKAGGTNEDFLEERDNLLSPFGSHVTRPVFDPIGADNYLIIKSKSKNSNVKDVTSKMNEEFNTP